MQHKLVRIFFALFPNKIVRQRLFNQMEILSPFCGGRKISMQQLHLTLLFLGNIAVHRTEQLRQAMKNVSANTFELCLDEIRYWKHNQIVYIHPKKLPTELFQLVESLKKVVSEAGFQFDQRKYKPHVSLIRKATQPIKIDLPHSIQWPVKEWYLVQSQSSRHGIDYVLLDQWHLQSPDDA